MSQIAISKRILEERSRNGLTQEELACRLGVTKAAVSKWECGQSTPDIALLPRIASLFSITLDDLFGYEPMASEEERDEVRAQLLALLEKDAGSARDFAEEQVTLHWSDPELLRVVALALYAKVVEPRVANGVGCTEAMPGLAKLDERILRRTLQLDPDSPSAGLILQSLCMLLASEGRDGQAAELVERMVPSKPNMAPITLADIETRAGDPEEAARTLKRQLLCSLIEALSCAQALCGLPSLGMGDLEQLLSLVEGMLTPQGFASLSPALVPAVRLAFATRLVETGDTTRALEELRQFTHDLDGCCKTLKSPQNPPFFDCVQDLLWQEGDEKAEAARDEAAEMFRTTFINNIATDEKWDALHGDPEFEAIIWKLKNEEESL